MVCFDEAHLSDAWVMSAKNRTITDLMAERLHKAPSSTVTSKAGATNKEKNVKSVKWSTYHKG